MNKRLLKSLILAAAVFALSFCTVYADEEWVCIESPWMYTLDEANAAVTIVGYSGDETEIWIPWSLGGIDVKAIANGAITGQNVTRIHVPDNEVSCTPSLAFPAGAEILKWPVAEEADPGNEDKDEPGIEAEPGPVIDPGSDTDSDEYPDPTLPPEEKVEDKVDDKVEDITEPSAEADTPTGAAVQELPFAGEFEDIEDSLNDDIPDESKQETPVISEDKKNPAAEPKPGAKNVEPEDEKALGVIGSFVYNEDGSVNAVAVAGVPAMLAAAGILCYLVRRRK